MATASWSLTGTSRIDAGGGIDTITFDFKLTDATFTWSGNEVIVDTANSHTVLTGFETYVFPDGTVNNNDGDVLVDDLYYYSRNHDVWNAHVDADPHYHSIGWHEWRDPNAFFSTSFYLAVNPDVKASGVDPLIHFDTDRLDAGPPALDRVRRRAYLEGQSRHRGRACRPARAFPADRRAARGASRSRSPAPAPNGFDYVYYLQHNPGRRGGACRSAAALPDGRLEGGAQSERAVRHQGLSRDLRGRRGGGHQPARSLQPVRLEGGARSVGRFRHDAYLAAYPDVAWGNINPLVHYLQYGIHEGR